MKKQPDVLKSAVRRVTKDWADIYARRDNAEVLVKSLLAGVERRILKRIGRISDAEHMALPRGADPQAFLAGERCADDIPNAILRRAYKS